MYSFIWRHLPGGIAGKLAGSLVLVIGAVLLLFLVIFPWASPKLPFNHVTVDTPQRTQSPPASAPATPG